MKRKVLFSLVATLMAIFLVGFMPIGVGHPFIASDNFIISDGEDAAIYITHNDNFSIYKSSGSGILADPYIISNFNLSSHGEADVYVANTDDVFILENFNISHDVHENEGYGIYFENVTNALIRDGNIVGKEHSIWLSYCENVRVARMYISNRVPGFDDGISNFDLITASGILVEGGQGIELRNNNIVRVKVGIHLLDSLNARVTDNTFRYSCISLVGGSGEPMGYTITGNIANERPIVYAYNITNGVYSGAAYGQIILDHCEHIAVEYADLSWVTIGLEINHCYEIRVKDSNMTRNWIGINAYMSEAIDILRCRVEYNMIGGHAWATHNVTIRDSSFAHNVEKGVWLDLMTSSSTIFGNMFINNTINAVDDGIPDEYMPEPITSDVGFIRVRVIDNPDWFILSGVNVTLSNSTHSHSVITSGAGVFNFTGLALGTYNLSCTKDNYISNEVIITLTNINWGGDYEVPLTHEARIYDLSDKYVEMYVKDNDGDLPISGVSIILEGITNHGMEITESFVTDVNGFANFTDIYLGMYNYTFSIAGYATITGTSNLTVDVVSPRTIYMTAQSSEIGFISVVVVDMHTLTSLSGVNVTLCNTTHSHSIITGITGAFNFSGLALGTYNLSCIKTGYLSDRVVITLTNINWGCNYEALLESVDAYMAATVFKHAGFILSDELVRVSNRWFDNGIGNYWDTYGGIGAYEIIGFYGNNYDMYPLDETMNVYSEPESELEAWSDSLEIYESKTPDDRINVNSFGIVKWKVRWVNNGTEITDELTMMIRVNGSGVDELLEAEYLDGWWTVSYNHTEVAVLEFSVYSVISYGMTDFVQLAENVQIIWDRVVIRTETTDTIVDITPTEFITFVEFELIMLLVILGMSAVVVVVVILYVIKKKW